MSSLRLVICASSSVYPAVIEQSYELEKYGFTVILPRTAEQMKQMGADNVEAILDWSKVTDAQQVKARIMREHFEEIASGDAVLVMNYEKHGKANYIGPNVLMEMTVAFYLNKPIYVFNGMPEESLLIDEILGLLPVFLEGNVKLIKNHLSDHLALP